MFLCFTLSSSKPTHVKTQTKRDRQSSPAGNRTPVSRVTGGDTHHYTTEDLGQEKHKKMPCRTGDVQKQNGGLQA